MTWERLSMARPIRFAFFANGRQRRSEEGSGYLI